MRKSRVISPEGTNTMDAERTNLIGSTLEDLQSRCADLRRYL